MSTHIVLWFAIRTISVGDDMKWSAKLFNGACLDIGRLTENY